MLGQIPVLRLDSLTGVVVLFVDNCTYFFSERTRFPIRTTQDNTNNKPLTDKERLSQSSTCSNRNCSQSW
jgi:hypothetical protein